MEATRSLEAQQLSPFCLSEVGISEVKSASIVSYYHNRFTCLVVPLWTIFRVLLVVLGSDRTILSFLWKLPKKAN